MRTDRITPDNIATLKQDEIFVFGSNLSGIHGGGAARLAHKKFEAQWGSGVGLTGKCYALPTKSEGITRSLTIEEIADHVGEFLYITTQYPRSTFLVTEIGCGLAGHKVEEIAPLFKDAIDLENVYLPKRFLDILKPQA